MTQRSAERWNTGKRGASQRRAQKFGADQARLNPHWQRKWLPGYFDEQIQHWGNFGYPNSPHLAAAFRRGAWKWVESQEVSI